MITLNLQGKHKQIDSDFHQQDITSLKTIHSIFPLYHGNISNFAFQTAQFQYKTLDHDELGKFFQSQKKQTGILCKNQITQFLDAGQCVKPEVFHPSAIEGSEASELLSGR
ncbi:uncharacterized protein VP01_6208g2 [Puccinia sorghi]|uniref:Uncharacterized protein n=1 Tax=Puccinia sorghi TaxID=27349 RepID=A0A0L6UGN2_9BASI|nr:uncharacterized protein VP01_6208g2 [Puccinia sorghi]